MSGILPSSLLCDESGTDCGLTDCARCLQFKLVCDFYMQEKY